MSAFVSPLAKLFGGGDPKKASPIVKDIVKQDDQPEKATREQRAQAAALRSRRAGRRALLSAGRLGGGDEDGQKTLGAG